MVPATTSSGPAIVPTTGAAEPAATFTVTVAVAGLVHGSELTASHWTP